MKRRVWLGCLISATLPVRAQPLPSLAAWLPLLQQDLLTTTNRAYRTGGLKSRAVFMGTVRRFGENQIQVRMIERGPQTLGGKTTLAMQVVDRVITLDAVGGQWYVINVSFAVQSIPTTADSLGPSPRQYLNSATPISNPSLGTLRMEQSDGPFANAIRELLERWQDG